MAEGSGGGTEGSGGEAEGSGGEELRTDRIEGTGPSHRTERTGSDGRGETSVHRLQQAVQELVLGSFEAGDLRGQLLAVT